MIGSKHIAMYSGGLQMGGYCLLVEFNEGGFASNRANLSSLKKFLESSCNQHFCHVTNFS